MDLGLNIKLGGVLSPSLQKNINFSKKQLGSLGEKITALRKTRLNIKEFQKLSTSTNASSKKLEKLSISLKRAGIDTSSLQSHTKGLNRELTILQKRAAIKLQIADKKSALSNMKTSLLTVGASAYGLKKFVDAASEVKKAQGEIRTLGVDNKGIALISKQAKAFSGEYAGTTAAQFIKASYDIKSGISSLSNTGVAEYTKMAALTASATKSTTAEMTNLFATGYGIYKSQFNDLAKTYVKNWDSLTDKEKQIESDKAFSGYFSSSISKAVQLFKTDGSKMANALSTLGAAASNANIPLSEQFTILGQLQQTFSGSEAATKYKRFLTTAGTAGQKLGLNFVDAQGNIKSTSNILEMIQEKYGGVIDEFAKKELKDAFGSDEAVDLINALIRKTDQLKKNQKEFESDINIDASLTKQMATAAQEGREFELLGQKLNNAFSAFGRTLYPLAGVTATVIGGVADSITWLDNKVPFLTGTIGTLTGGTFALITAMKAARMIKLLYGLEVLKLKDGVLNLALKYPTIIARLKSLTGIMNISSIATGLNTAKIWTLNIASKAAAFGSYALSGALSFGAGIVKMFNVALLASPLGVIVGIAGAGYLIYKNWGKVKELFKKYWFFCMECYFAIFFAWQDR
jgi:TP901 family phage tail tape measure protein